MAEPRVVGGDYTPAAPQVDTSAEPIAMTDSNVQKVAHADLDNYLDIPAFLRKQAD
jgi:cell division protein FtsZ